MARFTSTDMLSMVLLIVIMMAGATKTSAIDVIVGLLYGLCHKLAFRVFKHLVKKGVHCFWDRKRGEIDNNEELLAGRRKECIKAGPIVSFNPELWLANSLSKITEKDCKKGYDHTTLAIRADSIGALGTALICYVIAKDAAEDNEESKKSKSKVVEESEQEYEDMKGGGEYEGGKGSTGSIDKSFDVEVANATCLEEVGRWTCKGGYVLQMKRKCTSKAEFCIEAGSVAGCSESIFNKKMVERVIGGVISLEQKAKTNARPEQALNNGWLKL
ncbi:hypothetical protein Tco_0735638 [Tanacetum coccineum]